MDALTPPSRAFSRNETLAVSIWDERSANSKFSRALARDYIITKKLIGLPVDEESKYANCNTCLLRTNFSRNHGV